MLDFSFFSGAAKYKIASTWRCFDWAIHNGRHVAMFRLVEANHVVQSAKHNIIESGTVLFWTALLGLPQAVQTRRVKSCKDLYENTCKSSQ